MYVTFCIVIVTVAVSFSMFRKPEQLDKIVFWPYKIWNIKEWYRLVSAGFAHADYNPLIFNMLALFSFGWYAEPEFKHKFYGLGPVLYTAMYLGALAIADINNLFKFKDNYNYQSMGASGGVAAVIFSYILFHPFGRIRILYIPLGIPVILLAALYLLYCSFIAKRSEEIISPTAHFTGAIFGFIFPVLFEPRLFASFVRQLLGGAA